ncbi:unnamed protein product [Phaedon cochleariae]|uniref:Uncharacterized protein n=1 Tax=Phaedon cochleariae TaxID=80249 RepID=A0A9N9X3Z2_PHACE|nr:unnamed protein product [Phaedon cochleariae]
MNPASRIWDIPPPPGTEEFELELSKKKDSAEKPEEKIEEKSSLRAIDRIDPYLKNPDYIDYEKRHPKKNRSRSRSKSKDRHRRRRYSRSRSRSRHRRSRSKSRRRRRRYSSSRSRSRSPGHRRSKHKRSRRRHSSSSRHSRSRSRSTSRSRHRRHRTKSPKEKSSSTARKSASEERPLPDADINEVDMKIEEEEEEDDTKDNVFKNDGSFLEMFKKIQEQQQQKVKEEPVTNPNEIKKPILPAFGKRRGGKVLKTGMVQKIRQPSEEENNAQDAWSIYMKEVRRYKEAHCDDDSKTRPLVK